MCEQKKTQKKGEKQYFLLHKGVLCKKNRFFSEHSVLSRTDATTDNKTENQTTDNKTNETDEKKSERRTATTDSSTPGKSDESKPAASTLISAISRSKPSKRLDGSAHMDRLDDTARAKPGGKLISMDDEKQFSSLTYCIKFFEFMHNLVNV